MITVSGSLTPRAPPDNTVASTAIGARNIQSPGVTPAELVSRAPGVQISRSGSSADLTTAGIRGTTSAQMSVYLAGIRLNDDLTGVADLSTIPLFMIQGIQVFRGNSPVDADRLGIGGSIMFEPRLPRQQELAAGATLGSFGHRAGFVSAGTAGKGAGALVGVSREGAENDFSFTGPGQKPYEYRNADATTTSMWTIGRFSIGTLGNLTTLLHAYEREKGAPGIALVPNELARIHTQRFLGGMRGNVGCGGSSEQPDACVVSWTSQVLRTTTAITDPLREVVTSPVVWLEGNRIEHSMRLKYEVSPALAFSAGSAFGRETVRVVESDAREMASRRLTARPAITASFRLGHVAEFSAILSAEIHATRENSRAGSTTASPGGRFGAFKALSEGVAMRANVGTYSRTPTLGELYGISDTVRGNTDVVRERNHTFDLGVQLGAHGRDFRLDADLFGFTLATFDMIAYRQSGPGAIAPYNVGLARTIGGEAMAGIEVLRHVRGQLTLTVMDARDATPDRSEMNDFLPFRSRLVGVASVEVFRVLASAPLLIEHVACLARMTHHGSKYSDSAGLIVIPAQNTVDVEFNLRFRADQVIARLTLSNVLDSREFDIVGAPLPGRRVYFSLTSRVQ
ncbi:MAG TPA: TonB-dependent receptor [Polyangiaceae bacterium]|nr:TonB-dependent receptor [Polyangiaceae bacterium]